MTSTLITIKRRKWLVVIYSKILYFLLATFVIRSQISLPFFIITLSFGNISVPLITDRSILTRRVSTEMLLRVHPTSLWNNVTKTNLKTTIGVSRKHGETWVTKSVGTFLRNCITCQINIYPWPSNSTWSLENSKSFRRPGGRCSSWLI